MKKLLTFKLFESMTILELEEKNRVGYIEYRNDEGKPVIETFKSVREFQDFKKSMKDSIITSYINIDKNLKGALSDPKWESHNIGDLYEMDGNKKVHWKIAYYPIFENGKTGEQYAEPRALVETPMHNGEDGTDFREIPLRYLEKVK
tara:strand:+ start:11578 stop:12018 length:441 start_codon:yes stop_codon:yes gene_type:complete